MATQIGVVKALIGNVTATATDGSTRTLQVGDNVYANELITTNIAAAIEIELNDGSVMDLGRSSQVMLDNAVFDPSATTTVASETDDVPDDIAAIQAALLAGDDPTEVGDATAAGAGVVTGNEGHAPVFVDYLNPTVRPEAGFDTIGVFNEYDLPEEDIIILDEEDGSPTTGNTEVFVDEDDLGGDIQVSFVGPSAIITAFGTDTGYFTTFPFKFGNNDEEPGDDLPPNSSTTQTGQLNASFGSDGAGSVGFQAEAAQPSGLTSGGQPVLFWVSADGSMLVGYTLTSDDYYSDYDFVRIDQNYEFQPYGVAEIIFTAEIPDSGTTDYAFTLHGPLDHAPGEAENNLFIDLAYTITDSDGDAASGVLRVNVDDDVPVRAEGDEEQAQIIAQVHEEGMSTSLGDAGDLSEGNRDGGSLTDDETSSHIAGSLHYVVSVGADAPATFSLIDDSATLNELLPGLYSKGESVSYSVSGDSDVSVLTAMAGDRVVFTMTVHSNGNWYFDLDDQLDHAPGDGENFTLLTGDGGYDISTVGSIDFTKILKVTDADGDELVWTDDDVDVFAVQVQDDVPTLVSVSGEFNPVTALVAEDALSTAVEATDSSEGILDAGQDNSDDEASGVAGDLSSLIVVNDGADEPVSVTFSLQADTSGLSTLYSNGEAVSYSVDGNVLTAMAGGTIIFTLTVNADGSWAFDLDDQLDHVDTDSDTTTALRTSLDGSTSVDAIDFSSIVTVSVEDFDGDVATLNGLNAGLFTISVQNDVPVANNETPIALTEGDAAINGNVLANDVPGADEPITLTQVDLGDGFVDITTGTDLGSGNYGFSIDGVGDYSFNANGNWTFEPADSVNNTEGDVDASFSYRIEDADGDNAEAMQPISIADGQDPLAGEPITLSLDDQNLADGSTPAVDDFDTGSIVFTPGSDPIASIVFSMDLSGLDASMTWERVSDNQIIGRDGVDDIVTLDLGVVGDTATITATLNDNYDSHPTINVDDLKALGSVGVVATDIDGDFATGIVNVEVSDDLPTANDDGPETVTEDATSFVSGNVLDNDDANADQAAAFVGWSGADAATIATLNSFGTLVQNGDGSWSYTLDNSLATTQALTAADTMDYVLNYTMADADGDEDTATLTITIKGADDDATVETAQAEGPDATVYEAGLNPDGSDAASDSETVTGSFDVSASDGILTVVIGGTTFTLAEVQAFDGSDSVTTGEGTLTLTGYTGDAMGGTIAYSYTLDGTIDNDSIVPSGDDAVTLAHFDDSVEISVNGLGGTTASDDLVIRAIDDVPAAEDYIGGSYAEGSSNNVVAADAASTLGIAGGADGLNSTLQAISFTGGQGSLFINGSGQLIYTPPANVVNPGGAPVSDVFSYTVTDNDGDFVTKQVTVGITDTGVTELSASNALVDEDDLPMGNDDSATGDDNPIGSGTISYTVGTDGFDSVSLSTTGDTTGLMTHDGDAVDTIWDSGSNTLIGYVAGTDSTDAANQVFTVTLTNINASGADYDVTLLQAVKHPDADNENNVDFTVNVSVLDNDGSEGITNFNVSIDDDVPVASPEENSGEATLEVNTNVMMILDVSGSMNDSANFQGMTRLQVMIKSSLELLDQYDAYGDVMVNIITFATSASNPSGGWVTVDQAKTIILGLTAGGNTNYDDALNDAINAFALGGKLGDGQNISYFMSDGEPNSNNVSNSATVPDGNNNLGGGSGIDSDEEDDWIDFLELNNINSFSLGMGTGVDEDELDPIAYDGVEEVDTDSIVVSDFADLQATLIGTIDVPPLSGNLIDGGAGADEGWIYSVTVGGVNYIYDQPNDNQSVSGGASNGSFDDTTNVWTITTPEGGTLSVDMDTGDYEYFGPDVVLSEVQEVFTFTISDYDGDMDSSTLTVTIDPAAGPMIVRDDFVLTNQDPVDIPDWALLANDTGPDSGSQIVSAVFNADEGSVTDNADSVEFDDDDTDGGSFSYTNTAGTRSDDGNVSVERQSGDTIQGDYLDEILVGGSGAETLDGGAGDDILIGGNGATGGLTQRISITADGEGNSSNNNFLQFAYLIGSLGVYVESISIDLRAGTDTNASFDDDWGPDYSNLSGLNPGDITSTVLSGSGDSVMTINFANNSFTNGGSFDLNIDIDNLSGDDGDDFGEAGVTATVTFSNGEVHNLVFEQVDGNTSIAQTLVADDVLIGGEGNDILQGGGGNDLLTGGDGDDIFLWKAGDDGTDITPAMDIVTDFNAGDDVLDIADLLQGEESSIDLTEYMNVTESGSNVVIEVTPSGSGNHTQVITMQNTSLSDLGANPADSQADIISSLISQGHIHVDQS